MQQPQSARPGPIPCRGWGAPRRLRPPIVWSGGGLPVTGPGVTNAATAIGQAWSDSVPMLVLSSENPTTDLGLGRGRLHEITSQEAVTAPMCAFSATARRPQEVPELIHRAFAT